MRRHIDMFKIAICDDEQSLIVELKKNLKRYADEMILMKNT